MTRFVYTVAKCSDSIFCGVFLDWLKQYETPIKTVLCEFN